MQTYRVQKWRERIANEVAECYHIVNVKTMECVYMHQSMRMINRYIHKNNLTIVFANNFK